MIKMTPLDSNTVPGFRCLISLRKVDWIEKYSLLNKQMISRHSQPSSKASNSHGDGHSHPFLLLTTITAALSKRSMATVHLPTELWIAIFHYLRPSSLRAVHCVSSALRDISSRFLFEDLHLELEESLQGASLKQFSERMAFLSSPGIAPYARRVQLSTGDNFGETPVSLDCRNKSIVVALRAIPFFVNLQSLHIYFWSKDTHADLSRLGLETLENLDELAITGCSFHSRNNPAAKIRVNRLSLRFCNFTHHSKGLPGLRRSFLPVIDPQALRLLALHFDSSIFTDWLEDDASPPTAFPNLRELRLTGSVSRAQLDKIFARFPSIWPACQLVVFFTCTSLYKPQQVNCAKAILAIGHQFAHTKKAIYSLEWLLRNLSNRTKFWGIGDAFPVLVNEVFRVNDNDEPLTGRNLRGTRRASIRRFSPPQYAQLWRVHAQFAIYGPGKAPLKRLPKKAAGGRDEQNRSMSANTKQYLIIWDIIDMLVQSESQRYSNYDADEGGALRCR
ncbi:hypothetical protein C8J57DRAFT_1474463 [Mycena rebaudengoi]|nr:hypothetical protein C8J57DRAFT_1474463 [Mycena rebaudengoi]